jgi:hypothetical protein
MTSSTLCFPLASQPSPAARENESDSINESLSGFGADTSTINESLDLIELDSVSVVLDSLRSLTTLMISPHSQWRVGAVKKPTIVHDMALKLELQAIALSHRLRRGSGECEPNMLTSFHIAMNIYISAVVRIVPMGCACLDFMANQLKLTLQALDVAGSPYQHPPDLLLWVLFIGGVVATTVRPWFREQLAQTCMIGNISTWDKARSILRTFPFVKHRRFDCESHCRKLWDEFCL